MGEHLAREGWNRRLASVAERLQDPEARAFAFRLAAEEQLRVKAAERPILGWGGWGRSFVRRFEDWRRADTVVTDSLWILVFGKYGAVGLASLLLTLLVPILAVAFRFVVSERIGIVIASALVTHTAWHWLVERGSTLGEYAWALPGSAALVTVVGSAITGLVLVAIAWRIRRRS